MLKPAPTVEGAHGAPRLNCTLSPGTTLPLPSVTATLAVVVVNPSAGIGFWVKVGGATDVACGGAAVHAAVRVLIHVGRCELETVMLRRGLACAVAGTSVAHPASTSANTSSEPAVFSRPFKRRLYGRRTCLRPIGHPPRRVFPPRQCSGIANIGGNVARWRPGKAMIEAVGSVRSRGWAQYQ